VRARGRGPRRRAAACASERTPPLWRSCAARR
jgi:hypothetical protein